MIYHTNTLAVINLSEWFRNVEWLNVVLIILGALILVWIARRVVDDFVKHSLRKHRYTSAKERQQRVDTLTGIFTTTITVVIFVLSLTLVLSELGVNWAAAATTATALGVVLGLAFQNLLKDITKGASIIMDNQMRLGDIVTIAGVAGVVEDLSLRYTRLRDLDGNVHIVPNGEIIVVTNHSLGSANVNLDVSVSYNSDIDKVIRVINELGKKMAAETEWKDIVKSPIQFLRVDSFGESGVNIKALGEVEPGMQWDTAGEFRKRLWTAFEREDIEIPLPQRVMHTVEPKSKKRSA